MNIPFVKAHGALNDFLLTWAHEVPPQANLEELAIAICHRNSGVGADGWMLLSPNTDADVYADAAIRLINSDGSHSEMSGNGTRCAAALLVSENRVADPADIRIVTGAGLKHLRLQETRDATPGTQFLFRMNMGQATFPGPVRSLLPLSTGDREVTILNVGNPQCAVFVESFDFDWRAMGAEIERHPYFPHRTNVSFVRPVAPDRLEVRFFERGAGETQSSGTGSTGAAAAARARGLVADRVTIDTPAGPLQLVWHGEDLELTGPAELTVTGLYRWNPK